MKKQNSQKLKKHTPIKCFPTSLFSLVSCEITTQISLSRHQCRYRRSYRNHQNVEPHYINLGFRRRVRKPLFAHSAFAKKAREESRVSSQEKERDPFTSSTDPPQMVDAVVVHTRLRVYCDRGVEYWRLKDGAWFGEAGSCRS